MRVNLSDICGVTKINCWKYLYTYKKGIEAFGLIAKSGKLAKIKISLIQNNISLLQQKPTAIIGLVDSFYRDFDYKVRAKALSKIYLEAFKLI